MRKPPGLIPLSSVDGFATAVFAYNHSEKYVKAVTDQAVRYRRFELLPSRSISIVAGGSLSTVATELTRLLREAGWQPDVLASGPVVDIERALAPKPNKEPTLLTGTVLVVIDPTWSDGDVARTLAAAARAAMGLRVVWVPTAAATRPQAAVTTPPSGTNPPATTNGAGGGAPPSVTAAPSATEKVVGANPQLQVASLVPVPGSPWCGRPEACPVWATWAAQVLVQLG